MLETHWISAAPTPSSRCIAGRATFTMLLSSVDMKVMATTVKSTTHLPAVGRGAGTACGVGADCDACAERGTRSPTCSCAERGDSAGRDACTAQGACAAHVSRPLRATSTDCLFSA